MADDIEELSTRLVIDAEPFLNELEAALAQGVSDVEGFSDQVSDALDGAGFKESSGQVDDFSESVGSASENATTLGAVVGRAGGELKAFGTQLLAGITILKAFQAVSGFLAESERLAIGAAGASLRFESQIISLQQTQGQAAGTIAEYNEFVDELARKYGLVASSVKDASAIILQAGSALGLTRDQITRTIESATIFSQATGKDLPQALEALNYFLQYGTTRGLKTLGVNLAAVQAAVGKTFAEMSQTDRIEALNVILAQMAGFSDTLAQANENLSQKQQRVNAEMVTAKEAFGEAFAAIGILVKQTTTLIIQRLIPAFQGIVGAVALLEAAVETVVRRTILAWKTLGDVLAGDIGIEEANARLREAFSTDFVTILTRNMQTISGELNHLNDNFGETGDAAGEMSSEVRAAMNDISQAIEEGIQGWDVGLGKAQQSFRGAVAGILLDDQRARFDAEVNLNRDLRDIDASASEDRIKTIMQAQVDEKRLREDFQRQLRDLETKYLFELEDAVRERDARQVLLLMRRFNLEKNAATDDFNTKQKRLREDTKFELAEIERRRQIARQQRIIAYQEELADLDLQKRRKFEDAQRNYQNELRDLNESIKRRLDLLFAGFVAEGRLTSEALAGIYSQYRAYLGPGGLIEGLYRYFASVVSQGVVALPGSDNYAPGRQPVGGTIISGGGGNPQRMYQRGGDFIATSPTSLMVGERPERVSISPLSGGMAGGMAGEGQRAKIDLNVTLDSGLEAKLVDRAMNETAEVVLSITRGGEDGR